jgi:LPXTG-site transpeptidase (sortase) family protein
MYGKSLSPFWLNVLAVVGGLVVLVGVWNLCVRAASALGGGSDPQANASALALGPALAVDPSLLNSLSTTATTTPLIPERLTIPSIGVNAKVEQVGLKSDGSMATPSNFEDVAWYSPGAKPGAAGNAVIAGHVDNALTTAGVFEHLSQLSIGDTATVSDASGRTLSYVVTEVEAYEANEAPTGAIFATQGPSQLVLITCDGQWDAAAHEFDKRLIVTAQLVQ